METDGCARAPKHAVLYKISKSDTPKASPRAVDAQRVMLGPSLGKFHFCNCFFSNFPALKLLMNSFTMASLNSFVGTSHT